MNKHDKQTKLYWIVSTFIVFSVLTTFLVAKLTIPHKSSTVTLEAEDAPNTKSNLSSSDNKHLPYERITVPPIESIQEEKFRLEKFTIHVGTYSSKGEAEQKILELNRANISAFYTPVRLNSRVLFHVRTGIFSSMKDAKKMQSQLASRNVNASVTKLQ